MKKLIPLFCLVCLCVVGYFVIHVLFSSISNQKSEQQANLEDKQHEQQRLEKAKQQGTSGYGHSSW